MDKCRQKKARRSGLSGVSHMEKQCIKLPTTCHTLNLVYTRRNEVTTYALCLNT